MKRSSVPLLLLAGGVAWTVGQAVLPDMGTAWSERLAAVAADRPMQALATGLFVLAGALLVSAAVVASFAGPLGNATAVMLAVLWVAAFGREEARLVTALLPFPSRRRTPA